MTVVSILTAVALALGVASAGMNAKTIYDIETDRGYVAAADELLGEQRADIEAQLAEARSRDDAVAEARAEALLATLRLVERRANVAAVGRQVEQTKDSFLEEQWQQFKADLMLKGVSAGATRMGFGKLQDAYVRGTNWPPDPSKSAVIFDPTAKQAVRVMLEGDRPVLEVTQFSDDLADTLTVVLSGYSVMKGATGSEGQAESAEEAWGQVREGLERIRDLRPLPDTLGSYIAASLVKQARADNPQIAGLSSSEQEDFLRDQTCARLRKLMELEPDADRAAALRAAQRQLQCPGAITAPDVEEAEEEEPPVEQTPVEDEPTAEADPEVEEPTVAPPAEDAAPAQEMVYAGTYSHDGSSGEIDLRVYESGDVTLRYRKTADASNDGFQPSAFWNTVHGTHENGAFVLRVNGNEWATGTFNEESVSGSAPWGLEFSGSRVR